MATANVPFRFGFQVDPEDVDEDNEMESGESLPASATITSSPFVQPTKLVFPTPLTRAVSVDRVALLPTDAVLFRRNAADVESNAPAGSVIATSLLTRSDLIPGVYEGGLKTWECAYDLATLLVSWLPLDCRGMRVLELGCGSALPGIVALQRGAAVDFQDYNADVLTLVTWPNIVLNCDQRVQHVLLNSMFSSSKTTQIELPNDHNIPVQTQLLAGSWDTLEAVVPPATYDLIVMSETIYDPRHYRTLTNILRRLLKPHASALIAAKAYYFGVGGSIAQFQSVLSETGAFQIKSVLQQNETVRREVLQVTLV